MTLSIDEFIRRFLLHILPKQFHRIRHVGLFANACRRDNLNRLRALLEENHQAQALDSHGIEQSEALNEPDEYSYTCPKCGTAMVVIECFVRGQRPRAPPLRWVG